ncbi:transglycosylase SLT domain-containing protein [Chenggangzhangella methanolivorans]|uniref:transglycosylase SLT domain-containing protein n=1 Tax=Chenggangzhangella methanolivorans TaxID=1437009 RepID=UPI0036216FC0
MRKSTIVVALLAATVASAEASPNSRHLAGGSQFSGKSQARVASTAAQTRKSERQVNAANAAAVPSAASRGAAAFTSARNAGSAPAQPQAPAPKAVASKTAGAQPRLVSRTKQARAEARARVREASARRLARKTNTVALTREVPVEQIEKPAGDLATNAPTGSIQGMVTAAAKTAGVSPALGHAVVKVESMYQPRATGKGGYIGLMQLSYQTARGMGFRGSRQALYEPSANLRYGMRYLAEAVRKAGGNTCAAVSKYQGGHAVKGVTRAGAVYCAKVRRYMASAS